MHCSRMLRLCAIPTAISWSPASRAGMCDTSMSLGANISSTEKWLPSLSAETAVRRTFQRNRLGERNSDRQTSKSLTAGFKRQW